MVRELGEASCSRKGPEKVGRGAEGSRISDSGQRRMAMLLWQLLVFLVVGLLAGWLASKIMRGRGLGLIGDLVVGVVGSVIGGLLFGLLGISLGGFLGRLVVALVGAIILLFLIRLIKKA
jgi:uncharacterized membrane protein YeaQ/YmgE (transglycosylase-associated protein family)